MNIWIIFIIIIILTLINGFFSAAEMAFVSLKNRDIKKLINEKHKKAPLLDKITKDSTAYLSTIQVAITFAGFLSSAFAGSNLADEFISFFATVNIIIPEVLAVIVITIILSYITLIFGELVPKKIAMNHAQKYALFAVRPVYFVMVIAKPFVKILTISTNIVLKVFNIKQSSNEQTITEKEIREAIILGEQEGLFGKNEKEILESVFRFDDLEVKTIMTQRIEMFMIDLNSDFDKSFDIIVESGFSRIPIYDRNEDDIIGILLVKDVLKLIKKRPLEKIDIKPIIRKALFIPEHLKLNLLFDKMQKTNQQIAIIIDEFGGVTGMVTLEDLLEEIVGNIYDEYDEIDHSIIKISDNTFLIDATIQITELNRRLNLHLKDDYSEYNTLAGLVISKLGYLPKSLNHDMIYEGNIQLIIEKIDENHIKTVKLIMDKEKI